MCEIIRNCSRWCRLNPISPLVYSRAGPIMHHLPCIAHARAYVRVIHLSRSDRTELDQTRPYRTDARGIACSANITLLQVPGNRCGSTLRLSCLKSATVTTYYRRDSPPVSRLITDQAPVAPRWIGIFSRRQRIFKQKDTWESSAFTFRI